MKVKSAQLSLPFIQSVKTCDVFMHPVFEQTLQLPAIRAPRGVMWSRAGRTDMLRSCFCNSTVRLRATAPLFQKFGFYGDKRGMSASVIIQFVCLPSRQSLRENTAGRGEKHAHGFMWAWDRKRCETDISTCSQQILRKWSRRGS